MDQSRLARLVLQSAESSRLLGVDFVPVYGGAGGGGVGAEIAEVEAHEAAPAEVVVPRTRTPAAASTPASSATGAPKSPAKAPAVAPPVFDTTPPERTAEGVSAALQAIRQRYDEDCPHKNFVTSFQNVVFGEGDPLARLMFIGEAPGAEEDKCGRPFVGRAGQLLNQMIEAMGLTREQVFISNVLKTRPLDNATPTSEEIRICAPYLYQQVAVIQPEVIVTLGLPASRAILETGEPMARLRGRWFSYRPPAPATKEIPVMPTYHPAFLLRAYTPENRAKVWSDLQQVMERLGLKGPQKQG